MNLAKMETLTQIYEKNLELEQQSLDIMEALIQIYEEENATLKILIDHTIEMIKGFVTIGAARTMSQYNKK